MKQDWKPGTMIYPLPALLVSCGSTEEEYNIITVAWAGTICTNPAMCYISVRPERHSYPILKRNMEFVINLTTKSMAFATDWCGVRSGKDYNKFEEMKLTPGKAKIVSAPIIEESPLCIECRVKEIISLGSHDMFIADVVNVKADDKYLNAETGKFELSEANPLVYVHGGYFELGPKIGKFGWSVEKNRAQTKEKSLKYLMKKLLLLIALLLPALFVTAQGIKNGLKEEPKINVGIKGGFNSSMYFTSRLELDGERMEDVQNNYKVGYFAAMFFRVHMKRHFIQPEIMYNIYKGEIAFNKNQNKENTLPELAKLNSTIHSLELPILYGYSFVKSRPYGMALFIGPKLEYVWKHKTSEEFEGFGYSGIKEELHPINISSVIGLGVNIANIFFDFRYEIGLTNISKSIIYEKDTDGIMSQEKGIFINRHRNVLSFSLGVIF